VETHELSRRTLLKGGGAAVAGLSVLRVAGPAHAFPGHPGDEEVLRWIDQPTTPPFPIPHQLVWEDLDSWYPPANNFVVVNHYAQPPVNASAWRLAISGLVSKPVSLSLADLKARTRREVDFTLECSGNHGLKFFWGGVGNARWAGAPLAPILREARIQEEGIEVVFWGADSGPVIIPETGALDEEGLPGAPLSITERFARGMTVEDALNPQNLLCYEMNGVRLPDEHGAPVRLIAPGWYGVANVKWLTRIEVRDQHYRGRFMAREYVTIREETRRDGETVWTFSGVRHDRLKSAPAKVSRHDGRYSIFGAAWGAPIAAVEVKIDDGPWMRARLDRTHARRNKGFAWRFWALHWPSPAPGVHRITSRAIDTDGNVQPAPGTGHLAGKVTFWESNGQITRRVAIP
jgi:DMSO/TMAO reductase YedYZ molybdopterin-dependent catalytic subunit